MVIFDKKPIKAAYHGSSMDGILLAISESCISGFYSKTHFLLELAAVVMCGCATDLHLHLHLDYCSTTLTRVMKMGQSQTVFPVYLWSILGEFSLELAKPYFYIEGGNSLLHRCGYGDFC